MGFPREFAKIQRGRRIAIPLEMMKTLGWDELDQVLLEAYQGKLVIENISKQVKPLPERLR